jgi:hypothetical protein
MRHLILSQEGDAHMQDARIGAVELLTLEELSKFLKNKIKRNKKKKKSKKVKEKKVRMTVLALALHLCSS